MHSRIAEGTEKFSEEARARVLAARRKAVEAKQIASERARQGADIVSDFYDRQPLVVGALAMAAGAALAGALPRSKIEDKHLGEHSRWLVEEAERIFAEESRKLSEVVTAAKDEAMSVADEVKTNMDKGAPGNQTAAQAVVSETKNAGKRVARAASDKAKENDLGNPGA